MREMTDRPQSADPPANGSPGAAGTATGAKGFEKLAQGQSTPKQETLQTATTARRPDGPVLRGYVLAELRCAALRARLAVADIDAIGIALKTGIIGPQDAVEALADAGGLDYLEATLTNPGAAP
jgi:hypothetical protein